jgi:hypothetical protein
MRATPLSPIGPFLGITKVPSYRISQTFLLMERSAQDLEKVQHIHCSLGSFALECRPEKVPIDKSHESAHDWVFFGFNEIADLICIRKWSHGGIPDPAIVTKASPPQ